MTWAQAVALIALMVAAGKFIDTFHRRATTTPRVVEWIRSLLVWLFVKLEEVRPVRIARTAFKVPVWLQLLTVLLSAGLVFAAGVLLFLVVNVFGNQWTYPNDVLYWTIGFAILLQLAVFLIFRILARYASDIVATITIIALPFVFVSIIAAPISAAADRPGISGLWLAIYLFVTLISGSIPILLVISIALAIMLLNYLTLAIRWATMRVADGASSPKVSPFGYFSALSGLLVLAFKTIGELL